MRGQRAARQLSTMAAVRRSASRRFAAGRQLQGCRADQEQDREEVRGNADGEAGGISTKTDEGVRWVTHISTGLVLGPCGEGLLG